MVIFVQVIAYFSKKKICRRYNLETSNLVTILACICFIFIIGKIFIIPIKSICKLAINSILGGVLIYIINLIGGAFNFHIGLNLVTSLFIGILGIPGSILLIILKILI